MKKKVYFFALILSLNLFIFSGCADHQGNNIIKNENKETSTNIVNTAKEEEIAEFDYKNKDSYYVVINGCKFSIEDKVADIQVVGYSQDSTTEEIDVLPKSQVIGGVFFRNANNKTVFSVTPINTSEDIVKCPDANIGGFTLDKYYYKNIEDTIEVCNGITIGTSLEQLEKTFGKPTEKDMREGYKNLGIKYTYRAGIYKYMEFEIDKESKTITSITWRYFDL